MSDKYSTPKVLKSISDILSKPNITRAAKKDKRDHFAANLGKIARKINFREIKLVMDKKPTKARRVR